MFYNLKNKKHMKSPGERGGLPAVLLRVLRGDDRTVPLQPHVVTRAPDREEGRARQHLIVKNLRADRTAMRIYILQNRRAGPPYELVNIFSRTGVRT